MNFWTEKSIEFANQRNYLDSLFKVYPMSSNLRREIEEDKWGRIKASYDKQDNNALIKELLSLKLFPIKDSYVAYLRTDPSSINRNPETVNRLAGTLYDMGLDAVYEKCTEPKETNRQIGPLFKNWISKKALGTPVFDNESDFLDYDGNAVLNIPDAEMASFAKEYLGYTRDKGLDLIARFNNTYVIGEAKFLTDNGGHQNNQFEDAVSTISTTLRQNKLRAYVYPIAICDGILYIPSGNKMHRYLQEHEDQTILSCLLLRDFLYSI